jgi:ribonuclease HI
MNKPALIFVDGAIGGGHRTGVAAIARTADGYFVGWASRQMGPMTNCEAEYQAVLLGLELASQLRLATVEIISDSEVIVRQMQGQNRVHSPRLKPLHQQACQTAGHFRQVVFRQVSRGENRLADALAADALAGRPVKMASAGPR